MMRCMPSSDRAQPLWPARPGQRCSISLPLAISLELRSYCTTGLLYMAASSAWVASRATAAAASSVNAMAESAACLRPRSILRLVEHRLQHHQAILACEACANAAAPCSLLTASVCPTLEHCPWAWHLSLHPPAILMDTATAQYGLCAQPASRNSAPRSMDSGCTSSAQCVPAGARLCDQRPRY